jgi:hypothetical protein
MPCITEPPSSRQIEEQRLNTLLDEIGDTSPRIASYHFGTLRQLSLDEMTARLCEWCGSHDVTTRSLELQIWWRDHRAWDAQRKAAEDRERERERLRQQAIAKLTPEELAALRASR